MVCGSVQAACGQKGPPLAPIVYLPRPVSEVVAKRIENDVVLQFAVPTVNTDGSSPADLRKIEVYAHTGALPAPADFLKYGTLVASVEVKQPPQPKEAGGPAVTDAQDETSTTPPPASTKPPRGEVEDGLVEQGSTISVHETLTPKHMEIGPMPPTRPTPPTTETPTGVVERVETPGTVNFDSVPQRYYTVVPISDSRSRRGAFAGPIPVALIEPLSPPEKVDVTYTADAVSLSWPAQPEDVVAGAAAEVGPKTAAGARSAVRPLDRETEGTIEHYADTETEGTQDVLVAVIASPTPGSKPKPTPALPAPPPPKPRYGYNVYEVSAEGAESTPAPDVVSAPIAPAERGVPTGRVAPTAPVAPLNATLLAAPAFVDPRVEFGVERCYVVRRVEMAGPVAIESAPSAPSCITLVDTFPPTAPKSLQHIAGGDGVTLLWEANTEADLGGYLVLRGEAPGDKLSPLTPNPIAETSFLDPTVRRGRTYVYHVVAVDRSTPPNQSEPSNPVEETIR